MAKGMAVDTLATRYMTHFKVKEKEKRPKNKDEVPSVSIWGDIAARMLVPF